MEKVQTARGQNTLRLRWLAAGAISTALLSGCVPTETADNSQQPTAPPFMACRAIPASVFPGEPVTLTATVGIHDSKIPLSYTWLTEDGKVIGNSQSLTFSTSNMRPGEHTFRGEVTDGHGGAVCQSTIAVRPFEPATISCTANPSTVHVGEISTIACNVMSPQNRPMKYIFEANNGILSAAGNTAILDTHGAPPGEIAVRAMVTDDLGKTSTAKITVSVAAPSVTLPSPQIQNTGREFLLSGDNEQSGYGLYSYLLWWSNPGPQDRARYLSVISAFLTIQKARVVEGTEKTTNSRGQEVAPMEAVMPQNLNVAYIPVTARPPEQVTADWILDNYDINRARRLLARLPNNLRHGPYIISVLHPLKANLLSNDHFLFQNLSSPTITDDIAYAWVQQFQSQAIQQAFWKPSMMTNFVLTMRDEVGALALQIPNAKQGLATLIQWIAVKQ